MKRFCVELGKAVVALYVLLSLVHFATEHWGMYWLT